MPSKREALGLGDDLAALGDEAVAVPGEIGGRLAEAGGAVHLHREVASPTSVRTSSWRYSHFATVMFDAERLASTVAPASAASVPGGIGTHRSSQTSVCSTKPGRCGMRDQDVGAERHLLAEQLAARRAAASAAGWNQRSS